MNLHRGEIVRKKIDESGVPKDTVAKRINYSRAQLYNFFMDPLLRFDIIEQIGKIIKYDFTQDFTDMPIVVSEPNRPAYGKVAMTGEECLQRYNQLWEKYTALLEDYKVVSDKLRILQYKYP